MPAVRTETDYHTEVAPYVAFQPVVDPAALRGFTQPVLLTRTTSMLADAHIFTGQLIGGIPGRCITQGRAWPTLELVRREDEDRNRQEDQGPPT